MTREELSKWVDELETCLLRAERGKKDKDLLMVLRWAHKEAKDELARRVKEELNEKYQS